MLRRSLILASALATIPFAATAADLGTKAQTSIPSVVKTYSWTGFHAGIGGGGQFVSAKSAVSGFEDRYQEIPADEFDEYYGVSGASKDDLGKLSAFGTIEIGYDYQFNSQFVVGVFGDVNFGKTKANHTSYDISGYNEFNGDETYDYDGTLATSVSVGNSWDVGARLGFLPWERTLLYGLVGYTSADIKSSATLQATYFDNINDVTITNTYSTNSSKWKGGLLLGAGVETALTDQLTLKMEYRHASYGKIRSSYSVSEIDPDFGASVGQSKDVTTDSVRAVLSYRF